MVGTAGCLSALPGGGSGGAASLALGDWETTTDGDADATVVDDTALDLRVYRCSTAEARTDLGSVTGGLDVAFDYTVTAEGWYESTTVAIVEDGEERALQDVADGVSIEKEESATTEGSVDATVDVDGQVALAFRLEPSQYCSNGDHANTFFEVRNIDVGRA